MPPKRVPIRGEPDFTTISDERLKGFIDLAQQMIFAYKYCDEEKTRVMKEIWKQLSDEQTDRLCSSAIAELDRQEKEEQESPVKPSLHKIKTVKRIKR